MHFGKRAQSIDIKGKIRIVHTQQVNDSDLFSFGKIIKKNFYFLPTNPTPELLYIVKGAKKAPKIHTTEVKKVKKKFLLVSLFLTMPF